MAFPAEVTMVPSFLLLKRFPLIGLAVAVATGLLAAWVLVKTFPRWSEGMIGIVAGLISIVAGFWLLPHWFGANRSSVTLLNTFWALVLPGAASGFSIFLLKGFFDSLPQELYESAEIDGAGEWTKFWTITMSLSKPILAVMALGAFTTAYSEFLMALVIIPDPNMWTLMVWLFQFQAHSHPAVIYASLVVAAIPTLLVFLSCQNIIMRGIVVPTEK
jgi:multiple sugar transport system permease protein